MRSIKVLSLVLATAIVASAFVGVSAALAESSLLCENDTKSATPTKAECAPPETIHYLSVKVTLNEKGEEKTEDAKAIFLTGAGNIECNVLLVIKLEDQELVSTHPLVLRIAEEGISYTNCTSKCTVTGTGADLLLLKTAEELGELTDVGFQIELNCPLFNCHYSTAETSAHFLGALKGDTGGKGHLTYTKAPLTIQLELAGICPTATLDVLLQALKPLYIRS